MPLEYSCPMHTVTESKGADPTEAADHLNISKIMWNKQFVVIKNNNKKTECVYRTTLTFCSVLVTTGYLLQLAEMPSLSILHTLKPHEDLWVYANYQTQLKHWHYMCVNVHAPIISMHMHFLCFYICGHVSILFDRISVEQIPCLLRPIAHELYSLCLMCCMAAKWDYGREQQCMRCLSHPCQDGILQHSTAWVQCSECSRAS